MTLALLPEVRMSIRPLAVLALTALAALAGPVSGEEPAAISRNWPRASTAPASAGASVWCRC
jgi:hypothetical protein